MRRGIRSRKNVKGTRYISPNNRLKKQKKNRRSIVKKRRQFKNNNLNLGIYSALSNKNLSKSNLNEDTFDVKIYNDFILAGIFDGHGGKLISQFLKNNLLNKLALQIKKNGIKYTNFRKVFTNMDNTMFNKKLSGGSTCTILYIDKNIYITAFVGDSPFYVFDKNCTTLDKTYEHDYENKSERERINKINPNRWEDHTDTGYGHRVSGLEPSRGFGDFYAKKENINTPFNKQSKRKTISLGNHLIESYTVDPEVTIKKFPHNGKYFVITSDGISNSFSKSPSLKSIYKELYTPNPKEFTHKIINRVKQIDNKGKGSYDDATIIIFDIPKLIQYFNIMP